METSQKLKALPSILFLSLCLTAPLSAKSLLFRQAVDTEFPTGPIGHLMDLSGAWSLALSSSSSLALNNPSMMANAVLPLSTNPDSLLHGYFLSPSYIRREGNTNRAPLTLGKEGWQVLLGRGNLNFPHSIFRGYLMGGYRDLSLNDDKPTEDIQNLFSLSKESERKRSVIISTGVSSTQNRLVSQKNPLIDSELLVTLRYDYEKGDFFTLAKAAFFFPTYIDLGANIAWFKVYRKSEGILYDEVSDDFIFGPRIRGRAWNHLAFDASVEWHVYRDFNSKTFIPGPRAMLSLIANF